MFTSHIEISNMNVIDEPLSYWNWVALPNCADILRRYPHELSGINANVWVLPFGISFGPSIVIGEDELTSALDVTTQSQVVMQMLELAKEHNSAIVMVTHNLGVAAYMSDYIIVMKKGRVVDAGTPQDILENPS
ncbi:MAG: hypothetical protein ACLUPK_08885 [Veillonella sp.]